MHILVSGHASSGVGAKDVGNKYICKNILMGRYIDMFNYAQVS